MTRLLQHAAVIVVATGIVVGLVAWGAARVAETSAPAGSGEQTAGATHACGPARARPSIDERFEKFDREYPEVWRLFERFAFELIERGWPHYSADAIVHRIRWHFEIERKADDFKINNNFVALYARKWARLHPVHADFFETRVRRSA